MPLSIRRATPADAAVVTEFNARLAQESEGKALDPQTLATGVAACLADPERKGVYFLAEQDGVTIGQLCITYEFSDWRNGWMWWIQSVYVRQQARRQGVFRALYRHVYEIAKNDPEVVGLRLYVEKDNTGAQRTYEDAGMERGAYIVYERYPL